MKASILAIASIGLAMSTAPAYAADPHLTPGGTTKTLSGPAGLGSLECFLNLSVTTDETPLDPATSGLINGGTNDPSQSDPGCAGVKVDSGSFTLTPGTYNATGGDYGLGYGDGNVSSLIISVFNPSTSTWTPCPAASLPIEIHKVDNSPTVEVRLAGTIPSCGSAFAILEGDYDLIP